MDFADGFDDNMIYDKAIMAKQEVDTGLLATVFMEVYPLKMRIIEDVLHDSSVRHAPFDMGYRGVVSIWYNHYEDFKQLTTWRRGDDGPVSAISESGKIFRMRNYWGEFSLLFYYLVSLFVLPFQPVLYTTGQ